MVKNEVKTHLDACVREVSIATAAVQIFNFNLLPLLSATLHSSPMELLHQAAIIFFPSGNVTTLAGSGSSAISDGVGFAVSFYYPSIHGVK